MKALAGPDDLRPSTLLVLTFDSLPGTPACNDQGSVIRPDRSRDAEAFAVDRCEKISLPLQFVLGQVGRFEDYITKTP